MQEGCISLKCVSLIVLDEADRMLDLGFAPDIESIMNAIKVPENKHSAELQCLMFSATWPESIQRLAAKNIRSDFAVRCGALQGQF